MNLLGGTINLNYSPGHFHPDNPPESCPDFSIAGVQQ